VTLLHLVLVKSMTNDSRSYAARRMFAGWRLAVHGLVVVFALAALMMVLFQKDFGDKELRKAFFGMLLVWFPSWVLHLVLVGFYSRQLYTPSRTGDEWESAG
jgi:hypothetical protein